MTSSNLLLLLLLLVALTTTDAQAESSTSLLRGIHNHIKNNVHNYHHNSSFCERISLPDPEQCTCRDGNATTQEGPLSFVVECERTFASMVFNDTLGLKLVVAPCDPLGSSISLNIVEENHQLDYKIKGIRAGEEVNIPIPGVSAIVPGIGHIGIDAAILIAGNPDELTLKVGVNACAAVRDKQVCASALPLIDRILPWWILWGTYSFGDICANNTAIIMTEDAIQDDPALLQVS